MDSKTTSDLLNDSISLLQQYESSNEPRLLSKLMSQLARLRKSISGFNGSLPCVLNKSSTIRKLLESNLPSGTFTFVEENAAKPNPIQLECFYSILAACLPLDQQLSQESVEKFAQFATKALEYFFFQVNVRFLDVMLVKLCFAHARLHEFLQRLEEIRPFQLSLLRLASLNRDVECELMLIQLLMRNYLSSNLYEVADKFASKVLTTPAGLAQQHHRSGSANASFIKILYYVGKVEAVKLNYSKAYEYLNLALRKAPSAAHGFQQSCAKLLIVVQLLMGDLPEKNLLTGHPGMQPYLMLSQSVHQGNTELFQSILSSQPEIVKLLEGDGTLSLVLRLRHNVIKAAVKRANIAYSHISLSDLASKIFPSTASRAANGNEAEFVAMKCIKDGVVDAYVTHDTLGSAGTNVGPCMHSKDLLDVYGTAEASMNIGKRVEFCLKTRRDATKAMRYEQPSDKKPAGEGGSATTDGAFDADTALDIMEDEMDF